MATYTNAAGKTFPLPKRPIDPPDCWVAEANDDEIDEDALMKEFAKGRFEEFIEFIEGLDRTIFWDFAESIKWEWRRYKEESRSA